eukprot:CAMPEP_0172664410 /NCGR_PEP_ID=MMETSP1074-20121228/6576_1 /TAXON_ID=2916 /ORGANISM="Ceratium fusus, Strain PA161109" /LENGTH=402 /DNA_ID=CAMNT_0013480559 /DNA_START=58 /DNA_END=1266 /DNA_ORIENTATION=+
MSCSASGALHTGVSSSSLTATPRSVMSMSRGTGSGCALHTGLLSSSFTDEKVATTPRSSMSRGTGSGCALPTSVPSSSFTDENVAMTPPAPPLCSPQGCNLEFAPMPMLKGDLWTPIPPIPAADTGARPPLWEGMSATRQLARQLSEERGERNKAVSALWARLEELNKQIQRLEAQSQPAQLPAPPALPITVQDSPLTTGGRVKANGEATLSEERAFSRHSSPASGEATLSEERVQTWANRHVTISEERVQALLDQMNESSVQFTERPPELACTTELANVAVAATSSGTGGSLDGPLGTTADAIAALQNGLKDLDAKYQQQAKEVSYLKGVLIEVHIGVQMNAIRASRIALQSTDLSRDERNQALSALDKKETECKSYIRKVCSGPQLADLMSALATEAPPV